MLYAGAVLRHGALRSRAAMGGEPDPEAFHQATDDAVASITPLFAMPQALGDAFTRFIARLREAMAAQAPQAMLSANIRANYRCGIPHLAYQRTNGAQR